MACQFTGLWKWDVRKKELTHFQDCGEAGDKRTNMICEYHIIAGEWDAEIRVKLSLTEIPPMEKENLKI